MSKKIKLIAETAWHHEGDFEFMKKLVTEITERSKADCIKFHLSLDLNEYIDMRYSLHNILKSWMLTPEQWTELIGITIAGGKDIILLLNDKKAINFGMNFNPKFIEIHSVCLNDMHLLEELRHNIDKEQRIILGIGGTDLYEVENAIKTLKHDKIIIMFGFQNYPTNYGDINLDKIRKIKVLYPEFEFGYADHTAWNEEHNILITLLVAATGMNYIEKHVTNIFGIQRCDWQSSITVEMFNDIADKLMLLDEINGNGLLGLNQGEKKYSTFGPMKKAALLSRDVLSGEKVTMDIIVFKRTDEISDCSQIDIIERIGKEFAINLPINTVLKKNHFKE